jgi:hypothetical protein
MGMFDGQSWRHVSSEDGTFCDIDEIHDPHEPEPSLAAQVAALTRDGYKEAEDLLYCDDCGHGIYEEEWEDPE